MPKSDDKAQTVSHRRKESFDWLERNYYSAWERAYKHYHAVRDAELGSDGKPDPDLSSVGSPLTWSYVRRTVARGTAQPPNLRFHAKDHEVAELISRTLMMQWDKAKLQRGKKKHFLQASLFGWSVEAWYWAVEEYVRNKRVDVMGAPLDPETLDAIASTYKINPKYLQADPQLTDRVLRRLLEKNSRGGMLPVKQMYKAYEGPKADFLFIGDCYPEPNFTRLQASNWFIVERRRNKAWIENVAESIPELKAGFQELMDRFPDGTAPVSVNRDQRNLKDKMLAVMARDSVNLRETTEKERAAEWTILEQHTTGEDQKLTYVGEGDIWIGEIDYPYSLDGKIAFTEAVLIDDLICGIGDSTVQTMSGIHDMHERQMNRRQDLIYNILRPLIGTSNMRLLEEPDLIKRHSGFRLVHMRGPGEMWVQGEQAAMAAAAAGLQDESAIMRMAQMTTGENNMSMAANVDPKQNQTAKGASIMAMTQDVLTKDINDMWGYSVTDAAEMMFLLNRSELSEPIEFDAGRYNRTYSSQEDTVRESWVKVIPAMFQMDGEIVAEVGSMLADDDDTMLTKAREIAQAAFSRPDLFNQTKARDNLLVAMGKGRELKAWAAGPPPPPPPPEVKPNITISAKWIELTDEERKQFLSRAGIEVAVEMPPGQGPAGPPSQGPGPGPAGPPPLEMVKAVLQKKLAEQQGQPGAGAPPPAGPPLPGAPAGPPPEAGAPAQ
jgi:hypothetical protein